MAGLVAGALLSLAPVFGFLNTAFHMMRAFQVLGTAGIAQPDALTHHVTGVLTGMMIGILLCPIGLVLFAISLIFYLRARDASPPPAQLVGPV